MKYLVCLLVFLMYLKWILIIFSYPFQVAMNMYHKRRNSLFLKILAFPYWLVIRWSYGGWEKYCLYQISLFPSKHIRKLYYQGLGTQCGKNVIFRFGTELRGLGNIKIGEGTIIGDNAILDGRMGLSIGRHVNLSSNVSIYTQQHNHRDPYFHCTQEKEKNVVIGDRVWLGPNTIILPGVCIGEGAVVAAGAVVTKNVAAYSVVAGVPAQKVNERPHELLYCFKGKDSRFY